MPLSYKYQQVARLRVMGLQWREIARIIGGNPDSLYRFTHRSSAYIAYERQCARHLMASAPDAFRTRVAAEIAQALGAVGSGAQHPRRRRRPAPISRVVTDK